MGRGGLAWALAGYSLAFAPGSGVLGGFDFARTGETDIDAVTPVAAMPVGGSG